MRSIFTLLLFALFIFADSNRMDLTGPNALVNYERYLAQLEERKESNTDTTLKRSLLYKLINITKYAPEQKPKLLNDSQIADSDDYIEGFWTLIEQKKELEKLHKSIRETEDKLSYLKKAALLEDRNRSMPSVEALQYAFYYKTDERLNRRLAQLNDAIVHNTDLLKEALSRIDFDTVELGKKIEELKKRRHIAQMELENLKIEKERLQLLGRDKRAERMQKEILLAKQRLDEITEQLIAGELPNYFRALKSKDASLFEIEEEIRRLVESLSSEERNAYMPLLKTLENMSAQRLGKAKILLHRTKEGLVMIERDLWHKLQSPLFSINEKPISSWNLIVALFILVAGFTLAGLYRRYIRRITHAFINVTPSNQIIVSNLGYYLILTVAFFIMLKSMGLDLSSLTLIAGALSVGIGFGLQNIVANFISGIILLFEKSIKIGDFLEINDKLRGRVVDIHMRSITIRTNDNIDILVPNQTFIQNDVINWTLSDSRRRMRIPFGVAYGTDIKKVKSAILDALAQSSLHYIRDDETKQPMVVMTEMGSSSVNFELFVWVEGDETLKPLRTADKFLVLIYNTLYENGIEIPFPQLDLHVRDIKDRLEIVKPQE